MRIDFKRRVEDAWDGLSDKWDDLLIALLSIPLRGERKRLLERLKLAVDSEPYFRRRPYIRQVRKLLEDGRYQDLETIFEEAFASKARNEAGTLIYNLYDDALLPRFFIERFGFLSTHKQARALVPLLALFDRWWQARPGDGFAGACCSRAYADVSGIFSNYDRGEATDRLHRHYSERSIQFLRDSRDKGEGRYLWNRAYYENYYGDTDLGAPDADGRLARALSFDPDNLGLYQDHLHYHRDIWGGTPQSLEHFIRSAMDQLPLFAPEEVYARLYESWFLDRGGDMPATLCDWALMKQGYDVMLGRYSHPSIANFYARFAAEAGDHALVLSLFHDRLKVIVPECWYDEDAKIGLAQALDTYGTAREEVAESHRRSRASREEDRQQGPWG